MDDGRPSGRDIRHAFPLALASEGVRLRIAAIEPGKRLQHRLIEMGLVVGTEVMVIRRGGSDPLLVGVGPTRLAIGHGMAGKILVEPSKG